MSLDAIRIRTLPNRGRVELAIGACRTELHADDILPLLRQLQAAAASLQGSGGPPDSMAARLLEHLTLLAESGRCCPTNAVLAEAIGAAGGPRTVDRTLRTLEARGLLCVVRVPSGRVIELRGGARTASPRVLALGQAA